MNPKTPSDDERDEITSLVVKSSQELSTRASLVTRGLRDIADLLRANSLKATQDQAWEFHKERRFAEAVAVCSAGLEIDPTDEILWQIMGVGLAEQGRNEEGLACLERALQIDERNQYCWVLKAHLLRRLNRTEEQLGSWRRVLGIEPDFQGAWKNVGRCLFDLGRYKDAVQAFDSEMRLNPLDEDCRSRRETALAEIAHNQEDHLSKPQLPDWNATVKCCPEDQSRLLFCLDHQCTHDLCPDIPHLDFALIPVKNVRPEVLQRSIQQGQAAGEYYVVHDGTGWHVLEDGEVGWDPESLPDGTVLLKTPEQLRGQLRGPFSKREAQNFVEEKKWRDHDQSLRLPRIVPHLWVRPDSDDAADGFAVGCSYCGESDPAHESSPCPKRSSYTWYEVLGVPEGGDENQIESAYRELVNKWDPKRLQSRDDIFLDCGYSETQIKWFNAAYAVLSDPVERREYDAERLSQRLPKKDVSSG
jgi:tetratricopeptide (TPR) repeat protein